jgi:flagellar export protein FliJ
MPERRRIAALKLIGRIRQHEIDGHAARMTALRAEQARVQAQIAALDAQVDREGRVTTPETASYLASFLRAAQTRRSRLKAELRRLDTEAEAIEAELLESFREAKVNDTVLDRARDAQKAHEGRQEAAATEEIARNVYLRQTREG